MISMVTRAFNGPKGVALKSGDGPFDTTGWRTERQLHSTRYLRQATSDEEASLRHVVPTTDGRAVGTPKKTKTRAARDLQKEG